MCKSSIAAVVKDRESTSPAKAEAVFENGDLD